MSDNEAAGPAGGSSDDLSLPKATVAKLVSGKPVCSRKYYAVHLIVLLLFLALSN